MYVDCIGNNVSIDIVHKQLNSIFFYVSNNSHNVMICRAAQLRSKCHVVFLTREAMCATTNVKIQYDASEPLLLAVGVDV